MMRIHSQGTGPSHGYEEAADHVEAAHREPRAARNHGVAIVTTDEARAGSGPPGPLLADGSGGALGGGSGPLESIDALADALVLPRRELLALGARASSLYVPRLVSKRSGGVRRTYAPSELLKATQGSLNGLLRPRMAQSPISFADSIEAARPHVRMPWFGHLDITDAFPSIDGELIHQKLSAVPFESRRLVVQLVTRAGKLVTGAPSSHVIFDLVLWDADWEVAHVARKPEVRVTRYSDNFLISGEDPSAIVQAAGAIRQILARLGLRMHGGRPIPRNQPQRALGLILNNGLSIPKARRARIRSELRAMARRAHSNGGWDPDELKRARCLIGWIRRLHPRAADRLARTLCRHGP